MEIHREGIASVSDASYEFKCLCGDRLPVFFSWQEIYFQRTMWKRETKQRAAKPGTTALATTMQEPSAPPQELGATEAKWPDATEVKQLGATDVKQPDAGKTTTRGRPPTELPTAAERAARVKATGGSAKEAAHHVAQVEAHFWRAILSWASSPNGGASFAAPIVGVVSEETLATWTAELSAKGYAVERAGHIFKIAA